jgi:hypothetical protein
LTADGSIGTTPLVLHHAVTLKGYQMIDDEKLYEAEMYSKIRYHFAWMAVHEPNVLGDRVHELMLFIEGKSTDNLAEIIAAEA